MLAGDSGPSSARERQLGCGFITWALDRDSSALDWLLSLPDEATPHCVMLSFGDPRPYARRIRERNARLLCQIHCMADLDSALDAGADVIVAQGTEAGGHGLSSVSSRTTFTFVPELADAIAKRRRFLDRVPLLLAAGGVADGRGLAAALCLGADGALVGTRLWASSESLASETAKQFALAHDGDSTTRSRFFDVLRGIADKWPKQYGFRSIRNELHRDIEANLADFVGNPQPYRQRYEDGLRDTDHQRCHTTVGEAVGLLRQVKSASDILDEMVDTAGRLVAPPQ